MKDGKMNALNGHACCRSGAETYLGGGGDANLARGLGGDLGRGSQGAHDTHGGSRCHIEE